MRSVFPNIFQALWYQRISVCSKAYAFWRSGRVCAHVGTWCVCAGARIRETFKSTKAIFYDPEPQEQEQGRPIIGTSISCKPMRMVSPVKQLPTSDGQGPSSYFTSNILDHVMVPREVAWGRRSQTSLHFHRGHFAPALCLMVGDQDRWGNPHHVLWFPYLPSPPTHISIPTGWSRWKAGRDWKHGSGSIHSVINYFWNSAGS